MTSHTEKAVMPAVASRTGRDKGAQDAAREGSLEQGISITYISTKENVSHPLFEYSCRRFMMPKLAIHQIRGASPSCGIAFQGPNYSSTSSTSTSSTSTSPTSSSSSPVARNASSSDMADLIASSVPKNSTFRKYREIQREGSVLSL